MRDPKEETEAGTEYRRVQGPFRRLIAGFQANLRRNPPIPPGAPDGYLPGNGRARRVRFRTGPDPSRT
jgi:hypothetical protein